jgi:Stage II sporulation protein M
LGINLFKTYSSRNKRIITIAIFFILAIIATSIGAMQTLSQQEATDINNELDQLRSSVTVQYIFGNNLFICLLMFIPVFGWIFGFIALYNTGVVVAAQTMTSAAHGVSPLLLFFTLFLFPFTWLEFISYSVGFAESFWLMLRGIQRLTDKTISFKRELRNLSMLMTIVTLMLLAGAVIEMALIAATGG